MRHAKLISFTICECLLSTNNLILLFVHISEPQGFGSMSQSSSYNDMGSPIEIGMTAEELEAARQEWQAELNQVEEEIQTLKQVKPETTP